MLRFAFSSNAFKKTDLFEAVRQVASAGYEGVEIMADVPHAYPPSFGQHERADLRRLLQQLGLKVSNVNAFTLFAQGDTYHPTWLEEDLAARRLRIEHTIAAIELAADLGATTVSIQPGGPTIGTGLTGDQACIRFADALDQVLPAARAQGVTIAIEPEPGLLIQRIDEFVNFKDRFYANEPRIAMNCDLGHLYCVGDDPTTIVRRFTGHIAHIHLEDIAANHVHQHLPLGKGSMQIPEILQSIDSSGYGGWVTIELYPYVSTAAEVAREAMAFLRRYQPL